MLPPHIAKVHLLFLLMQRPEIGVFQLLTTHVGFAMDLENRQVRITMQYGDLSRMIKYCVQHLVSYCPVETCSRLSSAIAMFSHRNVIPGGFSEGCNATQRPCLPIRKWIDGRGRAIQDGVQTLWTLLHHTCGSGRSLLPSFLPRCFRPSCFNNAFSH